MGPGTDDDRRNFGFRITEALAVKVEWVRYIFDLRLGFKREGKWKLIYLNFFQPVTQNFHNGIFTVNVYVIKTRIRGVPLILPRIGLIIRPLHDWYFQFGVGILFDRGEFGIKLRIAHAPSEGAGDTMGWNEGSV